MTFTLDDPARLVIDLLDLENGADLSTVEMDSDLVSRVRVGAHADKIRVVVDGGSAADPFDGRRIVPTATGLMVALGRGTEIDAALAMATEATAVAEIAETASDEATDAAPTEVADIWPTDEADSATTEVTDAMTERRASQAGRNPSICLSRLSLTPHPRALMQP